MKDSGGPIHNQTCQTDQTSKAFVTTSSLCAKSDCPVACLNFAIWENAHDCETGALLANPHSITTWLEYNETTYDDPYEVVWLPSRLVFPDHYDWKRIALQMRLKTSTTTEKQCHLGQEWIKECFHAMWLFVC